jgi:hypothetical protein
MSNFDYFGFEDVDYVLPDGLVVGYTTFQTKSLNQGYATLVVSFDGSLILGDLFKLFWHIDIQFYAFVNNVWHEYLAHFQDGVLTKIEVV